MGALPELKTIEELKSLLWEIGFLPLFKNPIEGFSVEDITPPSFWFDGEEHDPWRWRQIIAQEHEIAYGKFFHNKAGFITRDWLPYFVNARRDGYDFDALYEDGKAPHVHKRVMDHFINKENAVIPAHILKQLAGFSEKGGGSFESVVTHLQMQTYLLIGGFTKKRNRRDEPYGWPVSQYAMPEALFGPDFVKSRYEEEPQASFDAIVSQAQRLLPAQTGTMIKRYLS